MNAATPKPLLILLVDDNPQLLKLMTMGLPDLGDFAVETAEDGIEGLTKCLALHPDCMVIDVMMPGLDGYQLVRTLRGDPETAQVPLILLTARVQDKDQFVGMASGADRYLCKPVMPSELSVAIAEAVRVGAVERLSKSAKLADTPFEETNP